MRKDTIEICEALDKAAELVEQNRLAEAQNLLPVIAKLISEWVERHLKP